MNGGIQDSVLMSWYFALVGNNIHVKYDMHRIH